MEAWYTLVRQWNLYVKKLKEFFEEKTHSFLIIQKKKQLLLNKLKTNLYTTNKSCFPDCSEQESFLNSHKDQLINLIALKYVDIRVFHEVRKINEHNLTKQRTRAKLTKLIHFNHE